jgi:signal transduction histidine kinase
MKKIIDHKVFGYKDMEFEEKFANEYFNKLIPQIRIGFLISIFIYWIFVIIDVWLFAELKSQILWNRIIISGIFFLIYVLSYTSIFKRRMQFFLIIFGVIAIVGILEKLVLLNSHNFDFNYFYPGLILASSLFSFYLRIRFIYATLLNFVNILLYLIVYIFLFDDSPIYGEISLLQTFINSLLFIVCSSFLTLYGTYHLEKISRDDFESRTNLRYLKVNLEKIVNERTIELENEKNHNIDILILGQEKERNRIAKELHDSVSVQLAIIKHDIEYFENKNDFSALGEIKSKLSDISQEIRDISHNQSPYLLLKFGLFKVIEDYINNIQKSYEIEFNLNFIGHDQSLNDVVQLGLFRVFQEAINNIIKHSKANLVEIQLVITNEAVLFTFFDNGIGFDIENKNNTGIGLNNIKLRIESQLKGKLVIDSYPGKGTTIIVNVNL